MEILRFDIPYEWFAYKMMSHCILADDAHEMSCCILSEKEYQRNLDCHLLQFC